MKGHDDATILYLIIGRIDPRKTMEGRRLASEGKFDPPANVNFLIEYEEPDGSNPCSGLPPECFLL
ncbi:MAG: hypothetical protein M1379_08575 [Firmicutes bacterium]|nr:hypothetical protein [Bacillota bacterium]